MGDQKELVEKKGELPEATDSLRRFLWAVLVAKAQWECENGANRDALRPYLETSEPNKELLRLYWEKWEPHKELLRLYSQLGICLDTFIFGEQDWKNKKEKRRFDVLVRKRIREILSAIKKKVPPPPSGRPQIFDQEASSCWQIFLAVEEKRKEKPDLSIEEACKKLAPLLETQLPGKSAAWKTVLKVYWRGKKFNDIVAGKGPSKRLTR